MPKQENLNVEIYLENVRCSHPHVFELTYYKDDKRNAGRYTCGFILDKKDHKKEIGEIEDAIEDVTLAKWGKKAPRIKEDNICFQDGDDTDKDELQGCMLLKSAASESSPPTVLGRDARKLVKTDGKPYGGCYVNALVRIYAYDKHDNQINCSLEVVQYFAKGESFGKGPADTSRFKDHGDDDDAEEYVSARGRTRDEEPRGRGRDRDEEPARGRGRDRDDEPRSRRGRDEEETPRRRSARDEDEREPPRRRSSRDDD